MDFGNESNWQIVYNGSHSATDEEPIGSILIPETFTQHNIRVYAASSAAKSHWWFAGTLFHLLSSNEPGFVGSWHTVRLKKITLIQLPKLTTSYRLKLEVPKWLKQIALVVESYIGEE